MANAADKEGLDKTSRKLKIQQQQEKADMILLVQKPEFLRFYGKLLHDSKLFDAAFDLNGSRTNFNLGRQDFGKELLLLIESVQPDALISIRRAMREREETENA